MTEGMYFPGKSPEMSDSSLETGDSADVCHACGRPFHRLKESDRKVRREQLNRLSDSQRQVLGYLLMGFTEPQIAAKLHRSRHTIHDHTKAIYLACGVTRRVHLVHHFEGVNAESLAAGNLPPELN